VADLIVKEYTQINTVNNVKSPPYPRQLSIVHNFQSFTTTLFPKQHLNMTSTRIYDNTDNDDGHEVEWVRIKSKTMQQRDTTERITSKVTSSSRESSRHGGSIDLDRENSRYSGPVDLDELFADDTMATDTDGESLFDRRDYYEDTVAILEESFRESEGRRYFNNPRKRRIDTDTSMIPGSPFSKPPNKPSTRPKEPLAIAKYASTLAFFLTFSLIGLLFFFAISNYTSVSRIM
jgi:hypothetical protein